MSAWGRQLDAAVICHCGWRVDHRSIEVLEYRIVQHALEAHGEKLEFTIERISGHPVMIESHERARP